MLEIDESEVKVVRRYSIGTLKVIAKTTAKGNLSYGGESFVG
jgi:hypothetical protein